MGFPSQKENIRIACARPQIAIGINPLEPFVSFFAMQLISLQKVPIPYEKVSFHAVNVASVAES